MHFPGEFLWCEHHGKNSHINWGPRVPRLLLPHCEEASCLFFEDKAWVRSRDRDRKKGAEGDYLTIRLQLGQYREVTGRSFHPKADNGRSQGAGMEAISLLEGSGKQQ